MLVILKRNLIELFKKFRWRNKLGQLSPKSLKKGSSNLENITLGDNISKNSNTRNQSSLFNKNKGKNKPRLLRTYDSDANIWDRFVKTILKTPIRNESNKSIDSSIQDELKKFNLPLVIDDNLINRHIEEHKKYPKSMSKFRKQKEGQYFKNKVDSKHYAMNTVAFDTEQDQTSQSSRENSQPKLSKFWNLSRKEIKSVRNGTNKNKNKEILHSNQHYESDASESSDRIDIQMKPRNKRQNKKPDHLSRSKFWLRLLWERLNLSIDNFSPYNLNLMNQKTLRVMSTVSLNQGLGGLEDRVLFSPQMHKWRSLNKMPKNGAYKRPYKVKSPSQVLNPKKTLKVINFRTIDEQKEAIPISHPKSPSIGHLPRINKLRMLKARLNRNANESHDFLENSTLQELADSVGAEAPIPFFKNQYSIGQKWIPYNKKGAVSYFSSM